MKRLLASRAAETVLASAEKIGTASRYGVLPFDAVAGIITDATADDPTLRALAAAGVNVVAARAA